MPRDARIAVRGEIRNSALRPPPPRRTRLADHLVERETATDSRCTFMAPLSGLDRGSAVGAVLVRGPAGRIWPSTRRPATNDDAIRRRTAPDLVPQRGSRRIVHSLCLARSASTTLAGARDREPFVAPVADSSDCQLLLEACASSPRSRAHSLPTSIDPGERHHDGSVPSASIAVRRQHPRPGFATVSVARAQPTGQLAPRRSGPRSRAGRWPAPRSRPPAIPAGSRSRRGSAAWRRSPRRARGRTPGAVIRARASASARREAWPAPGHAAVRGEPGKRCQSASVMNGTIGCSSRSAWSNTCTSTARAHLAIVAPGRSRALTASTYQSASSLHTNRARRLGVLVEPQPGGALRSPATPSGVSEGARGGPSAASHSSIATSRHAEDPGVRPGEPFAHPRVEGRRAGRRPRWTSRNRPMFHSLVAKLRPGANDFSRSSGSRITSAPSPMPGISV